MSRQLLVSLAIIIPFVDCQIRIVSPDDLITQFKSTHGTIKGSTSVFGTPYYGDKVINFISINLHCYALFLHHILNILII